MRDGTRGRKSTRNCKENNTFLTKYFFSTEMLMSILGCLGLLWFLLSLRFQNIDSFVTVVLDVRSKKSKDLLKIISKKDGIEDILFTNNNAIAYVKFSRSKLDKKIFDDLTYLGDFDG